MIRVRRSEERGHADHGWLDARHTFSFASYFDPDFMGFGQLRVLNQDRVRPGQGFATHGHEDMEIVTYVIEGELAHRDSMGNGSKILPGELQLMSAGTGVTHSEFNASEDELLHLLQMWILPARRGTAPRYEQRRFDFAVKDGRLPLVVAPDGADGALTIGQDARLFVAHMQAGEAARQELGAGRCAWLHVAKGRVRIEGGGEAFELAGGDGAGLRDLDALTLRADEPAQVVLWDMPEEDAR